MQLRTGKVVGLVEKKPMDTKDNYTRLYISEIRTMMEELEEWNDCPSARMAGLVDIYEYIDEHCETFDNLHSFHESIGRSARTILDDVARIASSADEETLCQMKMLAPILISVIAKLG